MCGRLLHNCRTLAAILVFSKSTATRVGESFRGSKPGMAFAVNVDQIAEYNALHESVLDADRSKIRNLQPIETARQTLVAC